MSKKRKAPTCECGCGTRLTSGKEIYPHRPDLHAKAIYKCDSCGGRVGCHPGTNRPLGTPAGPALRKVRMDTHRILDPIWNRSTDRSARKRVYGYLAAHMNLPGDETHIGMFNAEQCKIAQQILAGVSYPQVRKWAKEQEQANV